MSADRPVVALVAAPGTADRIRPLVAALARRADAASLHRSVAPDAVLVADPAAVHRAPAGLPRAVADDEILHVTSAAGDERELPLPGPDVVATATLPPLAPHVRRRWRERFGLAPDLVVDCAALAPEDVPTALAVAAAALVDRRDLATALALGCPTVTTASAAAAVGAVDGEHVVVGLRPDAVALAADDRRAAALSLAARRLAVARLDPDSAARALLTAWGLAPHEPGAGLTRALDELGTAPDAPVRARALAAVAGLSPHPGGQ